MSMNASSLDPLKRHTYRIALYGRRNSGKSCILAALGLGINRTPHPEQLACVWVNDSTTIPIPPGGRDWQPTDPIPADWDLTDPAITRHLGRVWMETEGIPKLRKGEVPRPTPTLVEPFRFIFDFSDADGRGFRVEILDYSGELVSAEGSDDLFAKKLRGHLESMDGILILAEAPRRGEELGAHNEVVNIDFDVTARAARLGKELQTQYEELNKLIQAFTLLAEERRGKRIPAFPVALIFNKWDRQTKLQIYSRAASEVELDIYLRRTPPPPQVGLLNVLRTVSSSTKEHPNCRSFALSAFGRARSETRTVEDVEVVIDVPVVPAEKSPLESFGMEDPFVWICERADKIEADRLVKGVSGLRYWNIPQLLRLEVPRLRASLGRFAERFPERAPERETVQRLGERASQVFRQQIGFAVSVGVLLFGMSVNAGYLAYDSMTYLPHERDAGQSIKVDSLSRWIEAESYFASYVQSNWYRTMSLVILRPPSLTRETLKALRERISTASKIEERLAPIEKPFQGDSAEGKPKSPLTLPEINELEKNLSGVTPPPGFDFLVKRIEQVQGLIQREKRAVLKDQVAQKLFDTFQKHLKDAEFSAAARLVHSQETAGFPNLKRQLTDDFRANAPRRLKERVRELVEATMPNWPAAEKAIREFEGDSGVKDLLNDQALLGKLPNLTQWIKIHRRNYRYIQWIASKDEKLAGQILASDDEAFKPDVTRFKEYQAGLKTPRNWILKISAIELDHIGDLKGEGNRYNPEVRVELLKKQDKTFIALDEGEIGIKTAGRTEWPKPRRLTTPSLLASDEVVLKINMTQYIGGSGTWVVGKAEIVKRIDDMSSGIQLVQDTKDPYWTDKFPGKPRPPRIYMEVESPDLPTKPKLADAPPLPKIEEVQFP